MATTTGTGDNPFGGSYEFKGGTTSTSLDFANMLKVLHGKLQATLNKESVTWDWFQELEDVEIRGSSLQWPVHTKRSGGVGAIGEGATLPTAGSTTKPRAVAVAKEVYGRVNLSLKVMEASKSRDGSFASAVADSMQDLEDELKQSLNRQVIGHKVDGVGSTTGIIARISNDAADGTTIQIDDGSAFQFYPGMPIRISTDVSELDGSSGSVADFATVTSITSSTEFEVQSVEADGNLDTDVANNDLICVGDSSFTSAGQELIGLAHICDNADELASIHPTDHASWKAFVSSNNDTNRNLSAELLDAMFDAVYDQGGKRPDAIIAHSSLCRQIKGLMENDVRYEPQKFRGGYERKMLVWNNGEKDVPVIPDKHVPLNRAFFPHRASIGLGWMRKFGWVDTDGSTFSRSGSTTTFDAVYGAMLEVCCKQRNAHGRMDDIKVNTTTLGLPA